LSSQSRQPVGIKLLTVGLEKTQCCVCGSIFILLSRESDGGAIFSTNPHPLWSCTFLSFPVVSLTSYHWICSLFEATK